MLVKCRVADPRVPSLLSLLATVRNAANTPADSLIHHLKTFQRGRFRVAKYNHLKFKVGSTTRYPEGEIMNLLSGVTGLLSGIFGGVTSLTGGIAGFLGSLLAGI
jgi:hypothetical protein